MKATIRLFKALPISNKRKKKASLALLEKTIKNGFVFSPEVISNYSNYDELIKLVQSELGLSAEQLNQTFHKSWKKIKEASIEQLVYEQLVHYFTTYGFEEMGIYTANSVYIPNEKLEIPELDSKSKEGFNLVVIKGYTKKELKEKLLTLLESGVALAEDTMTDILEVIDLVGFGKADVEKIKNREVKIRLYEELGMIPSDPVEFLRYLVYKSTGNSLLIKNPVTIQKIKENNKGLTTLFIKYRKHEGLERLAEIFYRFKPLFLAFRESERLKPVINKIRKLAKKYHKPMPEDYLNSVTQKINAGHKFDGIELRKELEKVNTFRKIRLAYALKYRTKEVEHILYRLRNGKGYATDFEFLYPKEAKKVLRFVLDSITKDISKKVKGKKIYIPEYMNYTLPATEKQFTEKFPNGSYVTCPTDMIFGIHWDNVGRHRIDLDLSLIDSDQKLGWDSNYRNEGRSILFSGDITDAPKPKGATELFYVKKQTQKASILYVNYYNHDEDVEVPFKILVAHEQAKNFRENYMVNPNNIVAIAKSKIKTKQRILGLLVSTTKENRFYFTETDIGCSITSSSNEFTEASRNYLFNFYKDAITLNEVLEKAGAKLIKDKEKCDIDLSPEQLEKDTILNLII